MIFRAVNPTAAAVLSILPGLGHALLGRPVRALGAFLLALLSLTGGMTGAFWLWYQTGSTASLSLLPAAALTTVVIAAVDAYRCALGLERPVGRGAWAASMVLLLLLNTCLGYKALYGDLTSYQAGGHCAIHDADMARVYVRVGYGASLVSGYPSFPPELEKARRSWFPNAQPSWIDAGCTIGPTLMARVFACRKCTAARAAWFKEHALADSENSLALGPAWGAAKR